MVPNKILVTQRISAAPNYTETRDALDTRWGEWFRLIDSIPILLPSTFDFLPYIETLGIDGILLTGGNDLSSVSNSAEDLARDRMERELLHYALQKSIPVFGVCRGMQLMLASFGGQVSEMQNHAGTRHALLVEPTWSRLISPEVNSYHHYGFFTAPEEFEVFARSSDGVVEGVWHRRHRLMGIMWHPERNTPVAQYDIDLMRGFFQGAKLPFTSKADAAI